MDHQPPPRGEKPHAGGSPANQTTHGTPRPTASARDPHEPEPLAERHDDDGTTPAGHGPAGNESSVPPAAARARTKAVERAANAPRPTPETRNTVTRGPSRSTTARSQPRAQPVKTGADDSSTSAKTDSRAAGTTDRDPENPRAGAARTAEETAAGTSAGAAGTAGAAQPPSGNHASGRQPRHANGTVDTQQGTETDHHSPADRSAQNGTDNRAAANRAKDAAGSRAANRTIQTQPENDRAEGRTQTHAAPRDAARLAIAAGPGAETELGDGAVWKIIKKPENLPYYSMGTRYKRDFRSALRLRGALGSPPVRTLRKFSQGGRVAGGVEN